MKTEMTKKERILATIKRQPIDRLPTQIDFSPRMLDIIAFAGTFCPEPAKLKCSSAAEKHVT